MSQRISGDQDAPSEPTPGQAGAVPEPAGLGSDARFPLRDNQETIISTRPPVPLPGQVAPEDRRQLGQFAPGDQVGPYELLEYVGGGGMGRVFRARDTQLSRIVALKVLARDQAADAETVQRFRNEARSAARLDHESFARVYYVGEDGGLPYLVFEFIEGATIRWLVEQRGSLPLADAVSYTLQVAEALDHAAARGVVHRDIKPSNVLITERGRAKVIDLGLARLDTAGEAGDDLTASGVTLGTFDYISPEQARDPRTVDVRSDIYSLGCTFFYMLAGRPPFPEGTVLQKLLQHQGDEPPDARQFRPELPEDAVQILRKMLAKDPARRFQTPGELVGQLRGLAERIGLGRLGPGYPAWGVSGRPPASFLERHLPWMAPVAALLAIVLFLDFLWSPPRAPGNQPSEAQQPLQPADEPAASAGQDAAVLAAGSVPPTTQAVEPPSPAVGPEGPRSAARAQDPVAVPVGAAPPSPPSPSPSARGEGSLRPDLAESALLPPTEAESELAIPLDGSPEAADFSAIFPSNPPPSGVASPSPAPAGVLTVGDSRGGSRNYPTLAAALGAASSGDIIELRYNGRREEKPVVLPNAKLILRAGQGFAPVVVFRPDEVDPVKCPRAMLALTGSELGLVHVALELVIPRNVPADRWTLIELGRAESLRLEKCSLTIRNAYSQQTAFIRVRVPAGADVLEAGKTASSGAARIELVDCIARGDAALADTDPLQPVHLTWTNGLLVTGERLLLIRGGDKIPPSDERIHVELKHLTAVVGGGLCRFEGERQARWSLPADLDCSDSIVVARPDSALVSQASSLDARPSRPLFRWRGDRNFYHGFSVFWASDASASEAPPQPTDFAAWQVLWGPDHEVRSRWERVDFQQLPAPNRPSDTHAPADYALSGSAENWARGAAGDGTDVGFLADRLPSLPPAVEPTATTPPAP